MYRHRIRVPVLMIALFASGLAVAQTGFNRIIAFGDSMTDPGNYYLAYGEVSLQPYEPDNIPSAPYAVGGHRFSNGMTWLEQLAFELQMPTDGKAALLQPAHFTNYAVGRSRARVVSDGTVFSDANLSTQVSAFLADFGQQAPSDALYVVWIGANDLSDALFSGNPAAVIGAAISATLQQVATLYYHGARKFLILNLPDFANTPALLAIAGTYPPPIGQMILDSATAATVGYNAALDGNLGLLEASLPGIEIIRMDVFGILNEVVADPQAAGFQTVTEPCITPAVQGGALCANPNEYLFWDGIHPTRRGHQYLAREAGAILGVGN